MFPAHWYPLIPLPLCPGSSSLAATLRLLPPRLSLLVPAIIRQLAVPRAQYEHAIKGQGIWAYVTLKEVRASGQGRVGQAGTARQDSCMPVCR